MRGRADVEQYVRAGFAAIPDLRLEKREEWVTPGGAVIASWVRFSGTFRAPLTAPGLPALAPSAAAHGTEDAAALDVKPARARLRSRRGRRRGSAKQPNAIMEPDTLWRPPVVRESEASRFQGVGCTTARVAATSARWPSMSASAVRIAEVASGVRTTVMSL